ncbi:MAG: class I SAM-dependent methyltransferase [Thermodesulfovibrionales bacterium]
MEYINCILCNEDNTETFLTVKDTRYKTSEETFTLVRCRKCKLVYLNPRPPKNTISKYYPVNYRTRKMLNPELIESKIKTFRIKRKALFFKNPWFINFPQDANVLDIGCGAGELLLRLKELGCNAYGIDIDEMTSKYLREVMNLNVITCDIENGTSFQSDFFDVVIMRHSLEHVYNPQKVLNEIRRTLKPSGLLLIGVPNIDSFVAKFTGQYWGDLDVPRHLFHFSPSTIRILLRNASFSIQKIYYELRMRRISIERWLEATSLPSFRIPKSLTNIVGKLLAIFHRSERIVVMAKKNN